MEQCMNKKGSLNIDSENMFPIIKKWLYQDQDIFVRELVSNGCDAAAKLKKLALIGECDVPLDEKYRIDVAVDSENRTMTFTDNGIGMTAEEVDKYINQVAFSGAADFLKQYKDKTNSDQIIGHFGLGFYSAFMVAGKVTIDTLSYKQGAEPVHWVSESGTDFEITPGTRETRGTSITLYLNEDCLMYCNAYKAREVLQKYCSFMPVEIYLTDAEKARKDAQKKEEAKEETPAEKGEEKPVNETNPLWNENPSKVTEEQYKEFYRKVFNDYREPLFWIHLNMDYPFNLKGILYFPRIGNQYETIEGMIKLYNNQVFIADNIKEVIPEYLMLLKGTLDCPDLPLNVSRSALQNDGFVKKISEYITKKVSDKLTGMFKTDRENYEKYWDDISPFIKYGCLKDSKFGDKMKGSMLFRDIDGKYLTADEYIEGKSGTQEEKPGETGTETPAASDETGTKVETEEIRPENAECEAPEAGGTPEAEGEPETEGEPEEKKKSEIFYVSDEKAQSQYIRMFREQKKNAVVLDRMIDVSFVGWFEVQREDLHFVRIDSDIFGDLKDDRELKKSEKERAEKLTAFFRKQLKKEDLKVRMERLKDDGIASVLVIPEEERRMQDMMKLYGMGDAQGYTPKGELVLNAGNRLVKRLLKNTEGEQGKNDRLIAEQLYDLALLAGGGLTPERMMAFLKRSQELMQKLD